MQILSSSAIVIKANQLGADFRGDEVIMTYADFIQLAREFFTLGRNFDVAKATVTLPNKVVWESQSDLEDDDA